MPKSSIAMRTPSARSSSSLTTAISGSSISIDSVISSISSSGRSPDSSSASRDVGDHVAVLQLPDRQVHAHVQRRRRRSTAACTATACRQASRSTQRPIGTISPVSSANGMKSPGGDEPALGVVPAQQRLHARDAAVGEADDRLVVQLELAAVERRAAGRRAAPGARARPRASPARTAGSCPCRRAWRCTSRRRRRGSARRRRSVEEPVEDRDADAAAHDELLAGDRSAAGAGPRARARRPRWRRRCSRGPRAARRTRRRRSARRCRSSGCCSDRRLATSISAASPAPWPRLSLIVLKSSMSRNITPSSRSSRRARPIAWRTRSTNSARLARLVTGSWNAWWASCSSKALRSQMSRAFSTIPRTCSSSSRLVCRISNWRSLAVAVAQRALDHLRRRGARRPSRRRAAAAAGRRPPRRRGGRSGCRAAPRAGSRGRARRTGSGR